MPARMKPPDLPAYYYHDHFTEMLAFVGDAYGSVLTEQHRAFVETFKTLSKDAQCLLIRMINRRGHIFRHDTFRYAEIANAGSALEELRNHNLVHALVESDYGDFILCHPKKALIKSGKNAGLSDIRTSWSAARLVEYFLANVTFETAHHCCGGSDFIALSDIEPVEFMLYLYFGKTETDLKNFALRDLGIIRTNKNANLSARFTDEAEARACFHYSRLLDRLKTESMTSSVGLSRRRSTARSARPTTREIFAVKPLTESVFILRGKVRARLQSSSIAQASQPSAMSALRGFFTPAAIRPAPKISSAG
jgi:DNA polymerase III subunit epsilon